MRHLIILIALLISLNLRGQQDSALVIHPSILFEFVLIEDSLGVQKYRARYNMNYDRVMLLEVIGDILREEYVKQKEFAITPNKKRI